jgi:pimeloyl-ACP methyl ester carboxylesterase
MPRIKAGVLNINYETFGEGEPLLLIMGFGMPGRAWLPRIPRFGGFKVIIYDNRGTGDSDKPEQPVYSIAEMADDASALLRALDIPRIKICGFSMGGMIAQELVLRHPEQVIKAVFGCTVAGGPTAKMENPGGGEPLRMASFKLLASDPNKAYEGLLPMLHPAELLALRPERRHDIVAQIKTQRHAGRECLQIEKPHPARRTGNRARRRPRAGDRRTKLGHRPHRRLATAVRLTTISRYFCSFDLVFAVV